MPERPRFETVDAYFAALGTESPGLVWMRELRRRIPEWVPGAGEVISYQMPAFRQRKVFVFYAPFARHLGIYPPVGGDEALQRDLAPYRGPKGNLQFPLNQPLPWDLVERVVKALAEELGG